MFLDGISTTANPFDGDVAAIYPYQDISIGERQAQLNSYGQMIGAYLSAGQLFEVLILSAGAGEP